MIMNEAKAIRLEIEEPSGVDRFNWPVSRGVPFSQGELTDVKHIILRGPDKERIPIQVKPLVFWKDGSIKWVLVQFQTTLLAQTKQAITLHIDPSATDLFPPNRVSITKEDTIYTIDTGPAKFQIDLSSGFSIVDQAYLDQQPQLGELSRKGVIITDQKGVQFSSSQGLITEVKVEEDGPLSAVLFLRGDHRNSAGEKLFKYEARLTAHAGHPWLEFEYSFINDADEEYTKLRQIGFEIAPLLKGTETGLVGAFDRLYEDTSPFSVYQEIPNRNFFYKGMKIYDQFDRHVDYEHPGEMLRKVAHGWMDISNPGNGISVLIKRADMMAPKAIKFTGRSMEVLLWPEKAGLLEFHQGMARTHRVVLSLHKGTGQEAGVNKLNTALDCDVVVSIPEWIIESKVFGDVFPYFPTKYPEINIRMRDQFNYFYTNNFGKGFFDYGDSLQNEIGDRSRYLANNENDLPQVMALMFARTGEREYYEVLEACAWHMMDIDFVHHSTCTPSELGGVRIHGNNHVQKNCEGMPIHTIATSHMWTEGLLSYYCLSGHPAALEKAIRIGDCLLNLMAAGWAVPPYEVAWHGIRDSAWPLIAFAALYDATSEKKWLDACEKLAEGIMKSQNEDGTWDLMLGWYNGNQCPMQTGIGLTGLARYHQLTQDERALRSMIKGADSIVEECTFPEGVLRYINAPKYRWNYYGTFIIEALGYIWNLTSDNRYLDIGKRLLYNSLKNTQATGSALAGNWRGTLRYMYWADRAGVLKDLNPFY